MWNNKKYSLWRYINKIWKYLDASQAEIPYLCENCKYKNEYMQDGDIIIADTAEDYTAGKCTELFNVGSSKIISGLHTIPCRPKIKFAQKYLGYYTNSPAYRHQLLSLLQGIKVYSISKTNLSNTHVSYPSLPEQQKIANFLFLVDARIEKQRQLVESLKKYKRGLFSYYFQKNKSYKIARLGDFAKIYQPSTISQSQFNDGKYKVFGANGYIGNYDKYNHAVPQVTISCRGEKCGTVNFVDAYTWITGNSMVVNIDDQNEINKRYLYHCLSNQNLKYLVSGSAQPQIIRTDVARHSIPVPSIEFQEKLSFFLDSIEEKIKNEQNMEECLLDMKNALLQQMFI